MSGNGGYEMKLWPGLTILAIFTPGRNVEKNKQNLLAR